MMIRDNMRSNVADAVCEHLERYAVDMPTTGAESPWQNNLAEGKNRILEHILDKVCMEFRADLESGKLEFEDILLDSLAAMDELPGSTSVKGKSPYELWHGRHPPTMPSPDSAHPQQLTDDLCDQVDLLETLRIRSQQIAQEARTDKVLREIFRKNIRPSRGPFHVGDMVYFWSGTSKKDTERWRGPAEIVLVDRTENCHVKFAGKICMRSKDLLKFEGEKYNKTCEGGCITILFWVIIWSITINKIKNIWFSGPVAPGWGFLGTKSYT